MDKGGVDVDNRYPGHYPGRMPHRFGDYPMMKSFELAEAYIPYQWYTTSFSPMEALMAGTMFPELVRSYEKKECKGGGVG
jgi:hypothetical protein